MSFENRNFKFQNTNRRSKFQNTPSKSKGFTTKFADEMWKLCKEDERLPKNINAPIANIIATIHTKLQGK